MEFVGVDKEVVVTITISASAPAAAAAAIASQRPRGGVTRWGSPLLSRL